jgi:hypothetical protein
MATKIDELMESFKAEEREVPPTETKDTNPPTETKSEETQTGTPPNDPPAGDGEGDKGTDEPPKPNADDDRFSRAEFSFKRKLDKMSKRHAEELAERDAKYNEMLKQFEELKKSVTATDKPKTREQFANDDEYIDYITEQRVKKILAERDGKDAERRAKEAEEQKKAKEQEAEIAEQQQRWLGHVDKCFGEDKERAQKFLSKIQYANRNGLGEILDSCPVASDYLMNNPNGPKVFEKMLEDPQVFRRVFNPQRTSPMAIYWELKQVEQEISTAPSPNGAPAPAPKPIPKMGKPGRQAGGSTLMGDMFDDPRQVKKWLKEHR